MIFQHTIDSVLAGRKTQTSRLWKDDYMIPVDEYDRYIKNIILSRKAWDAGKIRHLYRVGQTLAIQPGRGKAGVGKIRITALAKRDVRLFTIEDFEREDLGCSEFYTVWASMYDKVFGLMEDDTIIEQLRLAARPTALYTALVINFELVMEGERA